ncbi:MAG: hypothetical protein QM778_14965 [Myxococcales bacterium]
MQSQVQLAREAWRSYASTGRLRHDLLRPEIYRSWQRCHFDHVSPRQFRPKILGRSESDRVRALNAPLIYAAAPYLNALSEAAGDARHATLLASPDGTLIDLRGDEISLQGADAMPQPGTLLAESAAGSNGIGTAIAEGKYVELYGAEHFISGFHDHLCLGLPLRNSDGELAGAVCLSVRSSEAASHLRGLFFAVARGIECELRAETMRLRLQQLQQATSRAAQSMVLLHEEVDRSRLQARHEIASSVETLAQGFPSELLEHARDSLERYQRSARTWQLASGVTLAQPMSAHELAFNVVELLQHEARLLRVRLEFGTHSEPSSSLANPSFVRLVLGETAQALRNVGPKGQVRLSVQGDGAVCIHSQAEDASLWIERRLPNRMAA